MLLKLGTLYIYIYIYTHTLKDGFNVIQKVWFGQWLRHGLKILRSANCADVFVNRICSRDHEHMGNKQFDSHIVISLCPRLGSQSVARSNIVSNAY